MAGMASGFVFCQGFWPEMLSDGSLLGDWLPLSGLSDRWLVRSSVAVPSAMSNRCCSRFCSAGLQFCRGGGASETAAKLKLGRPVIAVLLQAYGSYGPRYTYQIKYQRSTGISMRVSDTLMCFSMQARPATL